MKITKFIKSNFLVAALLLGGLFFVQGCGDDDDGPTVDPVVTTALQTAITDAKSLIASTTEGTAEGQYQLGSQATLQSAIDLAQGVLDNAASTQVDIDNTVIALNAAVDVFNNSKIIPVDPDNLVGHWTFDDATGTTVEDFSGNDFTGTFGNEAGFGDGNPEWTTDRYGNADKALLFDLGAKVTVPYNTALNPAKMSISVWVRADENRESNRFIGLHSWNGYKFQLQSADKPFFTAKTSEGIYDRDSDPELTIGTWFHLTVTIGDGEMIFYVNGTKITTWDNTPGTMATVVDHDLVFGVGSSKYAATTDNFDADQIIPLDWGGYYHGALDEIRIYKSVLTESQVGTIYDTEKVP